MKSGNLNFLEPSGPLQACNGTDVKFMLKIYKLELVWSVHIANDRNKTAPISQAVQYLRLFNDANNIWGRNRWVAS